MGGQSSVKKLIEKEKEILKEKAKLIAEGEIDEPYTTTITIRLRPSVKQLYQNLPLSVKRAARRAFEATVLAYYLGGSANMHGDTHTSTPIIINMNVVEARAEARSEARVDLEPLVHLLEELLEELRVIRSLAEYPSGVNAENIQRRTDKLIMKIRQMRERLLFN